MPGQCAGPADLVTIAPGKLFAHEEFPDLFVDCAEPILALGFAAFSGAGDGIVRWGENQPGTGLVPRDHSSEPQPGSDIESAGSS